MVGLTGSAVRRPPAHYAVVSTQNGVGGIGTGMGDGVVQSRARGTDAAGSWSDEPTRASLRVLAEGAAVLAGFAQSAISVRRGDGLEVVATSGPELAAMVGTWLPVEVLEKELEKADDWGDLAFVPHERVGAEVLEYSHVSDLQLLDAPDAWHPLDLMAAPLYDDAGVLRGLLTVDAPVDGLRPGPRQREVLARYAGVARSSVVLALEREELADRVRMATEAREMVRRAMGEPSLERVIEACRASVVSSFDAVGMWLSAFGSDGVTSSTWFAEGGHGRPVLDGHDDVLVRLARRYWADQYVAHFSVGRSEHPGLEPEEASRLLDFLDGIHIGSVLFVPLGAGLECLGFLALSRVSDDPAWTQVEYDAALDIGRDLGRAVANARQLDAERAVVHRLRDLDGYRSELVSTVAHELRNPLTSVVGNLELLEDGALSEHGRRSVESAVRGARRIEGVIDDLLTVAHVSDPDAEFDPVPVDVRAVVGDVLDECAHAAASRMITVWTALPDHDVPVLGRADQLHRMLANLVSNALKYSDGGGSIAVGLAVEEEQVAVSVTDHGLGISEEDQQGLFREFFRSRNPEALSRPGSGLGLVIVDRIVRRHGGRIAVDSTLGLGTTITVTLPAAPAPSPTAASSGH
jgi:two-component system, OmpR family, phosphate regulon sensor histidine kinase PhoR